MGYLDLAKQATRRKEEDKSVSFYSPGKYSNKRYSTEEQSKSEYAPLGRKGKS